MKRPSQAASPKKGTFECCDSAFLANYPELARGLCDCWWDDGKPREPWTIKVSMRSDCVMLTITDKDNKLVSFTSADGLTEAFMAVEAALAGGGLSWRKSRW